MRNLPILTRPQHGFGSRHPHPDPLTAAFRLIAHWLRQASNRAIGTQLSDLRLNPFVFLIESGR